MLGAMLRVPLRLIPKNSVVRVRTGINKGMKWIVGSGIHGCWLGHYELEKQAVLRRMIKPGMKVFDIGANAGFYTLAFARLVGKDGHVWAFEPFAENVHNLRRHIGMNGLANVTVVQAAVSEANGMTGFMTAASNSMGHLSEGGDYLVPTVSLDGVCSTLEIDCPDFIKLDVEGAEGRVLGGTTQILAKGKTSIVLALHGRDQEQECLAILRHHQYDIRYLDDHPVNEFPLRSDEIMALPRKQTVATRMSMQ